MHSEGLCNALDRNSARPSLIFRYVTAFFIDEVPTAAFERVLSRGLANALSALYPSGSDEKRLVETMLLAVPPLN
jgi:hypothetical protein